MFVSIEELLRKEKRNSEEEKMQEEMIAYLSDE